MKAFVKREKAITSINGIPTKVGAAPRIIQGRSVEVKIATGPFTWAFGKRIAEIYNSDGYFLYAGSRSGEEIGEFFDKIPGLFGSGRWWAVDARRWDRSVGPSPMALLFDEYRDSGAPTDCLEALAGRDKVRKGTSSRGWHYTRRAQVSSGDGDTSAGNTRAHLVLLEACEAVKAAIAHGDDAVIFADDIEPVLQQYQVGDFVPVLADEVDFCSSLFWPTPDGSVLGPKVGRVLGKTFHCAKRFDPDYLPWLRGVCLSLRTSCSFVPILRILIPRLLLLCGEGKVWRDDHHDYKSLAIASHDVCDETWTLFYQRYGLHESDVLNMEEELSGLTIGTTLLGDRWTSLVERDIVGTSFGT